MTKKLDRGGEALRIADMLAATIRIEKTREQGRERFFTDADALEATVRRLEIVGEAAGKVSQTTKDRYPEIAWKRMRGFASFAKHVYWEVKPDLVWKAVEEMPVVRQQLMSVQIEDRSDTLHRE